MIKYVKGNLFEKICSNNSVKLIPHVCNNLKVMKSGFAKELTDRHPTVRERNMSTTLGAIEIVPIRLPNDNDELEYCTTFVINMISQHQTIRENTKPIRYKALVECMDKVRCAIESLRESCFSCEICCPKFGSGLARGSWPFIEELINEIWCDISVTVYEV